MNKNYTLKELASIGSKAAYLKIEGVNMSLIEDNLHQPAREAFTKAVLDAIGYEFPKDEEREAFERWLSEQGDGFHPCGDADKAFTVWQAGREELRRAINKHTYSMPDNYGGIALLASSVDASKEGVGSAEPAWIPWEGGECPLPDTVKKWEYEVRAGAIEPGDGINLRFLRWNHTGGGGDILAYRVWEG